MKFLDKLTNIIEKLTVLLLIVMLIPLFSQVIARYVFGRSFFWAEEMARFSMVWITFLGAALCVKYDKHTRVTFFVDLLPVKLKKYLNIFNKIVCLLYVLFVAYYSVNIVSVSMNNLSSGLRIPMGIVYISLPLACLLIAIYLIVQIYTDITTREEVADI